MRYVDPTGHTAEGAELQGVLRETKDYFQSQAKGSGVTGFLKGVGFGILSGAVGIVESAVGLVDEGATVAYTVPGVDVMGDPTGVESREEIKQQVADLKQTYHVIKEEGFFNTASRIAGNAKDTLIAAAKGDPQAIAKVTSFATEIVGPTAALKGSGALGAMRRGAKELVEGAGRAVRHGWDEAAGALRRGGDDLVRDSVQALDTRSSGALRLVGDGPGAALRRGPDFQQVPTTGLGQYGPRGVGVRGHHIHAKKAFEGASEVFSDKEIVDQMLAISGKEMEAMGIRHLRGAPTVTSVQRRLFDELAEDVASGIRRNTLKEHNRIAVEALVEAGASWEVARKLVADSARRLRELGIRTPTKIPWN